MRRRRPGDVWSPTNCPALDGWAACGPAFFFICDRRNWDTPVQVARIACPTGPRQHVIDATAGAALSEMKNSKDCAGRIRMILRPWSRTLTRSIGAEREAWCPQLACLWLLSRPNPFCPEFPLAFIELVEDGPEPVFASIHDAAPAVAAAIHRQGTLVSIKFTTRRSQTYRGHDGISPCVRPSCLREKMRPLSSNRSAYDDLLYWSTR